jgi:hypothetical protein
VLGAEVGLLEMVPTELLTGGGLAGIVTLAIWMIFTGRLVAGRHYQELRDDRDHWRKAHEVSEEGRAELRRQNDLLLEAQKEQNAIMLGLQNLLERAEPRGR